MSVCTCHRDRGNACRSASRQCDKCRRKSCFHLFIACSSLSLYSLPLKLSLCFSNMCFFLLHMTSSSTLSSLYFFSAFNFPSHSFLTPVSSQPSCVTTLLQQGDAHSDTQHSCSRAATFPWKSTSRQPTFFNPLSLVTVVLDGSSWIPQQIVASHTFRLRTSPLAADGGCRSSINRELQQSACEIDLTTSAIAPFIFISIFALMGIIHHKEPAQP